MFLVSTTCFLVFKYYGRFVTSCFSSLYGKWFCLFCFVLVFFFFVCLFCLFGWVFFFFFLRSDCFLCFITCFTYSSFQKENLVRDEVSISLNNTSCKLNVNETEIRAFVGCLLFLGALKENMLPTTVVFAAFYEQELVRAAFSRNRLQLLSFIRFDDKTTRNARRRDDVFARFREFWDKFTQNLKQYYIP